MNTHASYASQLLGRIYSHVSTSNHTSNTTIVQDFLKDFDSVNANIILTHVFDELRTKINRVSVIGNFEQPLDALKLLVSDPVAAQALVNHESWIPKGENVNGRFVEVSSILGPFLHVGALIDHPNYMSLPNVGKQYFSGIYRNPDQDVSAEYAAIRYALNKLYDRLTGVFKCLLKNNSTRNNLLDFLAEVINKNWIRAHMQVDPLACASDCMFMNLCAVMLRLCEPFLDLTKMDKLNAKYVLNSNRLEFRGLTALNASTSQVAEWFDSNKTENETVHNFITECFFMTARVLNLSLIKGLSTYTSLHSQVQNYHDTLASLTGMKMFKSSTDTHLDMSVARLEQQLEVLERVKRCYEAQIFEDEKGFIHRAMSFYRMMMVWLVELVGGFESPSPITCPKEFAFLPEHFVDDAMELLLYASWEKDGQFLEDFMHFIITFMARPEYIKNPYLRAKMVDGLYSWKFGRDCGRSSVAMNLLEKHHSSLKFLVRNLLKVYVDMESIGNSQTQFHDKFDIRHKIAKLLQYLWKNPGHHQALVKVATEEEKGIYFNFLNSIVNDSIYLLDEGLTEILELKNLNAETSETMQLEQKLQAHMLCVNQNLEMVAYTSKHVTEHFLLPDMVERVANMLNFFLLKLIGPGRNNLRLKEPERYHFFPQNLLKQTASIYVNLARGDKVNILPAAVAKDGGMYNEALFNDAPTILRKIGLDERDIQKFVELGCKAKVAADKLDLGEIPEDFIDPIQCSLMKDPVILPSKITVDRSVIERHLLNFSTDPFNHTQLTVDMLKPNVELKAQIHEFIRSRMMAMENEDRS